MDKALSPHSPAYAKMLQHEFWYGRNGELLFNHLYQAYNTQHVKLDGL
jgi:hypothetical protein